jgi:hypothetical protein
MGAGVAAALALTASAPCCAQVAGCDGAAFERAVATMRYVVEHKRGELAVRLIRDACNSALPADLNQSIDAVLRADPEKREEMMSSGFGAPFWTKGCPDLVAALKASLALAPAARRTALFDACHFERLDLATRDEFAESYSSLGPLGGVYGALLYAWMVDHRVDKATARNVGRTILGTPPFPQAGNSVLPTSSGRVPAQGCKGPKGVSACLKEATASGDRYAETHCAGQPGGSSPLSCLSIGIWPDSLHVVDQRVCALTGGGIAEACRTAAVQEMKAVANEVKEIARHVSIVQFTGVAALYVHEEASYATLTDTMILAGQAGFDSFRLIVVAHDGTLRHIPVDAPSLTDPHADPKQRARDARLLGMLGNLGADKDAPFAQASGEPPVLRVDRDGFRVSTTTGAKVIAKRAGEYDFEALTRTLSEIQAAAPDSHRIVVSLDGAIAYKTLIRALDASREAPGKSAGDKPPPLFYDVTLR